MFPSAATIVITLSFVVTSATVAFPSITVTLTFSEVGCAKIKCKRLFLD